MFLRALTAGSALGLIVGLGVWSSLAQDVKASPADDEFFTRQVRPIFEANCFQCHNTAGSPANNFSAKNIGISHVLDAPFFP